jgi:DMSO/TMAO reductase YedYZ molybdopterin-dependent catalytic subunit
VVAVGGAFVDRTPAWLKDFAVATFGTADKAVLLSGIFVVLVVAAAAAGVLAARRRTLGLLVVAALGAVATAAVLSRPGAQAIDVLPTVSGPSRHALTVGTDHPARRSHLAGPRRRPAVVPAAGRRHRGDRCSRRRALAADRQQQPRGDSEPSGGRAAPGSGRRRPPGSGAGGRTGRRRSWRPPPSWPTSRKLSPLITPVADFYRIDTALAVPQVASGDWRLRIHGMVEREVEISFAELLALPLVDRMVTLSCVSNEVGGDLVGNQVWRGHPLRDLLATARPAADADMVLSTSADGWTAGTPLDALTDPRRDALLAVGMDGQPLPLEHGFPVRMVVPGLYGYVSATKWVVDLEVTRFDRAEGYWTPRGWSARGPIKTSRASTCHATPTRCRPA